MTWVGKVVPKDQRTVGLEGTAQPHPCCRLGAPPARAAQSPSMSSGTSRDGAPYLSEAFLSFCSLALPMQWQPGFPHAERSTGAGGSACSPAAWPRAGPPSATLQTGKKMSFYL